MTEPLYMKVSTQTPTGTANFNPPTGYSWFVPLHVGVSITGIASDEIITVQCTGTMSDTSTGVNSATYDGSDGASQGDVDNQNFLASAMGVTGLNSDGTTDGKSLTSYSMKVTSNLGTSGASAVCRFYAKIS